MSDARGVSGGGDGAPLKVSETILRNLRVLATDQRTDAMGPDGKPVVQTYSNVTVEVTPKIIRLRKRVLDPHERKRSAKAS